MANYSSYKANRISGTNIDSGAITNDMLTSDVRTTWCVKWVRGTPSACSPGCCCLWTVPSNVKQIKWELWGAGGNGHGACSCNRCQHFMGAGGGTYATKTISTTPGCQYTVCAGGVYRCYSRECNGCNGCTSYVNGYNLSGFCACGGGRGCANGSWTDSCFTYMSDCRQPGQNGSDFANNTHQGPWSGAGPYMYPGDACHCWKHMSYSSAGMMMNTGRVDGFINYCWIRCGCWTVPYASGGQGAKSSYCGRCCGQGGTGGSGVVKITYF
jgi:hypothetical protein